MARERRRLASGSPANEELVRSNFRLRFNCPQMSAARQTHMERYMTSAFATVDRRDRTQSKKSRAWFIGRRVRAAYPARTFA